jgi:hypothetical protein
MADPTSIEEYDKAQNKLGIEAWNLQAEIRARKEKLERVMDEMLRLRILYLEGRFGDKRKGKR